MAKGPEFELDLHPEHQRFAIVVARFNRALTELLLNGATEALADHGVPTDAIDVLWVPGCFEIPLIAYRLAASGGYHAVICLGAVVRGETAHFEHVARETASGIAEAGRATGVPVLFGVLTTENWQQALDRAGGKEGNKGHEAAMAAMEMASLLDNLPPAARGSIGPEPTGPRLVPRR